MMVVFIALIAAVLVLVVLLQSGQGGGLAGIAQGGATRQVLGSRQAPDVLEKATWTLAAIFITLCVISNFFIGGGEQESVIQNRAQEGQTQQQSMPAQPQQGGGCSAPAEPGRWGAAGRAGLRVAEWRSGRWKLSYHPT